MRGKGNTENSTHIEIELFDQIESRRKEYSSRIGNSSGSTESSPRG